MLTVANEKIIVTIPNTVSYGDYDVLLDILVQLILWFPIRIVITNLQTANSLIISVMLIKQLLCFK
jgi:hypothetical protein